MWSCYCWIIFLFKVAPRGPIYGHFVNECKKLLEAGPIWKHLRDPSAWGFHSVGLGNEGFCAVLPLAKGSLVFKSTHKHSTWISSLIKPGVGLLPHYPWLGCMIHRAIDFFFFLLPKPNSLRESLRCCSIPLASFKVPTPYLLPVGFVFVLVLIPFLSIAFSSLSDY